jgi:predicted metal-dependent enzyme (double-stranded beta helix superfamily)
MPIAMNLLKTRLCLDDFILEAMRLPEPLQLEQLQDWVARLDVSDDLVQHHLGFGKETYQRQLLCRTTRFDMLILGWRPGQSSTIHDHNGSLNVTRVYQGTLTARSFAVSRASGHARDHAAIAQSSQAAAPISLISESHLNTNDLTTVDRYSVHQLANESDENLVTLHVYARPLQAITVYCSSGASMRVPVGYGNADLV